MMTTLLLFGCRVAELIQQRYDKASDKRFTPDGILYDSEERSEPTLEVRGMRSELDHSCAASSALKARQAYRTTFSHFQVANTNSSPATCLPPYLHTSIPLPTYLRSFIGIRMLKVGGQADEQAR